MKFINRVIFITIIFVFVFSISNLTLAYMEKPIVLDDPELFNNSLNHSYDLVSMDLRLPEIDPEILNNKSQNKLINLVLLYGARDDLQINKEDSRFIERFSSGEMDEYRLNVENDDQEKSLSVNPLPGISVDADFNKDEEDNSIQENTNVSLKYWMNNKTLIRAKYGMENKEWWDIREIKLENGSEGEFNSDEPVHELTFNEEKNQTSSLGISFQTNDRVTISADYIDSTSMERDFSTLFGVEYKDDVGTLKYHYQVDFGEQNTKETGLELGYKDLATFNATYKIFDPKVIEDQLDKSMWDFGLDVNLNDISTISLGYQLKKKLSDQLIDLGEDESNIQAELKIKF